MRLLITTQAVDLDDPVLGFFHRWIEAFASRCESVHVICLKEGRHQLPPNVTVHSLGKEGGVSRLKYVSRFFRYVFTLPYDAAFVHMNEEYVLLGGLPWMLMRKQVILWRNHKIGSWRTKLAGALSRAVCYTSPAAYVARFMNAAIMPIGIDTANFRLPETPARADSVLFLGRLDPVKKPEVFLQALELLAAEGVPFHADGYGEPTYPDAPHVASVHKAIEPLSARGVLTWHPSVTNSETTGIYGSHAIYVNLTPSGSFDKTIGEAMACGCIAVVANDALRGVLPEELLVDPASAESVARGIRSALTMPSAAQEALVQASVSYIEKEHSLSLLVNRVRSLYSV